MRANALDSMPRKFFSRSRGRIGGRELPPGARRVRSGISRSSQSSRGGLVDRSAGARASVPAPRKSCTAAGRAARCARIGALPNKGFRWHVCCYSGLEVAFSQHPQGYQHAEAAQSPPPGRIHGPAFGLALAQTAPRPGAGRAARPHSFTGKVALYSEYEYRGIAQTSEKPALQLNLDYAHASGFYLGTFLTNIKWLEDIAERGAFDRARASSGTSTAATR